tara:strand:- start:309 stop:464 length:156 start_codon:yes stop_codon:yes gene_type:complete
MRKKRERERIKMFKDFPGLCKEQTSQTEADKSFKIDVANKCTHYGLPHILS